MKVLAALDPTAVDPRDTFLVISCSRRNDVKQIVESAMTQEKGHEACTQLGKQNRKDGQRCRFIVRRKTDVKIIEEVPKL